MKTLSWNISKIVICTPWRGNRGLWLSSGLNTCCPRVPLIPCVHAEFQITCVHQPLLLGIWVYYYLEQNNKSSHNFLFDFHQIHNYQYNMNSECNLHFSCCTENLHQCLQYKMNSRILVMPSSSLYLGFIKCIQHYRVMSATVVWGPPQTTSKGSRSTFDTTTVTLSGRRTVSLSRNTDRNPRSLLLWSQRMTQLPLVTASSTSWWDISPEKLFKWSEMKE